jgi:hypothetical protein
MDLQQARDRFERAMGHCDAIVQVHQQHGGGGQGFRSLEPSLNRAIVVLAVAAWQGVVQDLAIAALDHTQPAGGGGVGTLLRGQVVQAVAGFSTPDAQRSRALLRLVDFDPYPAWTWTQMGGRGVGAITISPAEAAEMTDDWLRLRHDIAHGHARLSVVGVLESVRLEVRAWRAQHPTASHRDAINYLKSSPAFSPSLRLVDARRCITHFRRMARLTAQGLAATGVGPNAW